MKNLTLRITDHASGFDQTLEFNPAANEAVELGSINFLSARSADAIPTPSAPTLEWSATLCNGERVNHAAAEKACAALGEGWRLPTDHELLSIVDRRRYNPAIDTDKFPDTKSGPYWTSTLHASDSSYAWIVIFSSGSALYYHRDSSSAFVRAVRSAPAGQ